MLCYEHDMACMCIACKKGCRGAHACIQVRIAYIINACMNVCVCMFVCMYAHVYSMQV